METLVAVAEHKNQCYGRIKPHGSGRFGSSPSRQFRAINCRTFQSGSGILPNPFSPSSKTNAKAKTNPSFPCSSESPSSPPKTPSHFRKAAPNSSPIPIITKEPRKLCAFSDNLLIPNDDTCFSELWAGPAYSNSPPPSSLPIPKFSMKPKRTVSLELPLPDSDFELPPIAKSAPASPSREHDSTMRDLFCAADDATKILRRILNLDLDN
ncbi:hypothetical protein LINGRAPRIM_LOCUS3238 [Linum grandiflorum]